MAYVLPKPASNVFLGSAVLYLILVSFIGFPLNTLLKPIPIACLIVAVLQRDMVSWTKMVLIAALGFSMAGDIILTVPVAVQLELGIGCFLLAHCCYIALFLKSFKFNAVHLAYFVPVLLIMGIIACLMIPYLGALLIPVMIYFCVLMCMAFSAFQVQSDCLIIGSGALFFLMSDLSLALNLFLYPQADTRIFVMFTYYVAQFLLTWGIVSSYRRI
ncbi:lysoplasmalogenase [Legionella sp. km535]|uniref:lysoplasmalogenase n=1 Tax=Legionella sp. km535 TaxID=2498107 RepID=UPI000F8E165C|nr:lysoplasmalogenase [Legionella sp. km535]RUR19294.1 lysoplasmalogenase [Legionella sp. km535]